jgi:hypothetical protein
MDPTRFDSLARSLGRPTSRRGALGLVVGVLALRGEGAAGVAKPRHRHQERAKQRAKRHRAQASASKPAACRATTASNSACAKFCARTFGADTPAASRCTSDATKCQGPCYQCGPACTDHCQTLCGTTCTTLGTNTNCTACADVCVAPETCGGGTGKGCGCSDNGAACQGKNCDDVTNNCGKTVSCGTCTGTGQTCGGGTPSQPNVCGCTPNCADKACGAPNGCGGFCPNETCSAPLTCGGGTTPNACGCLTATTCCGGPGQPSCSRCCTGKLTLGDFGRCPETGTSCSRVGPAAGTCASNNDCLESFSECRQPTCCGSSGASTTEFGGDCALCCSGECQDDRGRTCA